MASNLEKTYRKNLNYLKSIIGLKIESAFQEEYYFDGVLDDESMGTLMLKFSNGQKLTFDCDQDAESLIIKSGDFTNKGSFGNLDMWKWIEEEYITKPKLSELGNIKNATIEFYTGKFEQFKLVVRLNLRVVTVLIFGRKFRTIFFLD